MYGAPFRGSRHGTHSSNQTVSLAQIIRYAIANSHEMVPSLGTPLRAILSEAALGRMPYNITVRTLLRGSYGSGQLLHSALLNYQAIEDLLGTNINLVNLNGFIRSYF